MSTVRQYCTFFLGEFFFGVDVTQVQEVLRFQSMTQVPLSGAAIQGLINLRGQLVTAVDLRQRLDMPPFAHDQQPMNVVIKRDDGMVSLLVDEICDVVEVHQEAFERVPETVRGVARELLTGAYKLDNALLLILDVESLLAFEAA
jgi:purine-binding chemotaxis protein CheW